MEPFRLSPFWWMSNTETRLGLVVGLCFALVLCAGCAADPGGGDDDDDTGDDDDTSEPVPFRLWSSAFDDGDLLPEEYECYQSNPALHWEGAPEGTVALALIFDDPTVGDFPHWAIYNIPTTVDGLEEGMSGQGVTNTPPAGASELRNGANYLGYLGSCPCGPSPNTYRWRLWALDTELADPSTGDARTQFSALAAAADEASLDQVELSHRYGPATLCR